MDDIVLNSFPRNEADALAMLYVQNQDLKGLTPLDLLDMYQSAREEICEELKRQYESRYEQL